jgi:GT2 family glycosyltransferase
MALVVVTRDRPTVFASCVSPGLMQTRDEPVEVVVVDESAGMETSELLEELPWVRRVRSDAGLSRGRNVGVEATSADLVVFTDDDAEFGVGWLARIRELFADPAVGVVCGPGRDSQGRLLPHRPAGVYRWPTRVFGLGHGFNLAFRRAALDAAGPFDEELGAGSPVPAGEDTDMIYRVMRSGWTAVCDDGIEVVHHSWRSEDEERLAHQAYGMGFMVQTVKHAREGDAVAVRIAVVELLDHLWWTLVALARRDRRGLGYQAAWTHGVLSGLAVSRRWPPGAARS